MTQQMSSPSAVERTLEFYLTIFLGLLSGYIFIICVEGGVSAPVVQAPNFQHWADGFAEHKIALRTLMDQGQVLGSWRQFSRLGVCRR